MTMTMTMFLKLTGSYIEAEVTGKYINRGDGYGLELPCKYHVSGQEKAVTWLSNKINLITKEHESIVNRCLDKKKKGNNKILIFDILVKIFLCLLYRGKFWRK